MLCVLVIILFDIITLFAWLNYWSLFLKVRTLQSYHLFDHFHMHHYLKELYICTF